MTPALCAGDPVAVAAAAVEGGVDLLQLRDKEATDMEFVRLARNLAALGVPLVLNDRVHLVAEAGARGAHVGETDLSPEEAREILGPGRILGLSTHDRAEVAAAAARGADYVGLGPMFPTATKELTRRPGGPELVRSCLGATELPVFLVGGITAENLPSLVQAGATRAAVSSAICAATDPREAALRLRAILR